VCVAWDANDNIAQACAAAGVAVVSTKWLTTSALHWRMLDPLLPSWSIVPPPLCPPLQDGNEAEVLVWLQRSCQQPCAQTPCERHVTVHTLQHALSSLRERKNFAESSSKALADLQVTCDV
jgi:hypothetical protein